MDRLFTYVGWLVAIGACIAAVLLYANLQDRESELELLRRDLTEFQRARAQDRDRRSDRLNRELEQAQARIAELEGRAAQQVPRQPRAGGAPSTPRRVVRETEPDVDAAALLEGMLAGVEANERPAVPPAQPDDAARALNANANARVNLLYREFLDSLAMDPAGKDAVRAVLRAYLQAAARAGMNSLDGGYEDRAVLHEEFAQLDAQLHEQLAALLPPEEMAYFDEYQQALVERQLATGIETQLRLMAPELIPENQQIVVDIMLDEVLARHAGAGLVSPPEGALRVQEEAYQQLLARARQYMEPEQFAVLERFVAAQQEMAAGFLGEMAPKQDAASAP